MTEQKPIQMVRMRRAAAANACPSSLQRVEAQTQHLAKRHLVFIGHIDEALDGLTGRLDVDLLIPTRAKYAPFAGRRFLLLHRLRRLQGRKIVFRRNARRPELGTTSALVDCHPRRKHIAAPFL